MGRSGVHDGVWPGRPLVWINAFLGSDFIDCQVVGSCGGGTVGSIHRGPVPHPRPLKSTRFPSVGRYGGGAGGGNGRLWAARGHGWIWECVCVRRSVDQQQR